MTKIVAFIPVRGGSVSIPQKNIKLLCGKPLVYWTVKAACDCSQIDTVVVSTDSPVIKDTVESFNFDKVEVIGRGEHTATNVASTELSMLEFAENNEFETIVLIQATSPLLTSADLGKGFERYAEQDIDGVVSVVQDKRFYWNETDNQGGIPLNYDVFDRPRRQDFEGCYVENGAFYISSRERLLASKNRVSGKLALSEMPAETSFEIDEPEDWTIVEALLRRSLQANFDLSKIKLLLTDCDGCLTDAGMYYTEHGDEFKKFNTRDGMAFTLLRKAGIKTGIVSSEKSMAVKRRAEKLKLDYLELGCTNKFACIQEICKIEDISFDELAYIGDDINDLEVLVRAGFSCCPLDAQPQVLPAVKYHAKTRGGQGVVREIYNMMQGNMLSEGQIA